VSAFSGKDHTVIIDEASQSGPEALFLLYLAKRIIVVGDDRQISPDYIGLTREDVDALRQRYLYDIPHNDAIGVDTSFFTLAEIRYGGRIRLKEHFRCMPEIIQFSNNLCYSNEPLIPLRQYGSERLEPVMPVYVRDGYQSGTSPRVINKPEAEAIAKTIEECCNDPRYDGKTMGMISLLGDDQARFIERLLLNAIGPEEIETRQLICGDAYDFQGDERDIIFLSMVSAPGGQSRIGTLTTEQHKRRFNVATSRAKDQMWLFHSATLNDLSPNCLRYGLLEYFQNPMVSQQPFGGFDLQEIESQANSINRSLHELPKPFDSWFEVDVFLKIAKKGYRVIPQYEIHGYRIDLVIEGLKGRIAVECDGDSWHGPEQYEQDIYRERILKRCGWIFWRIRGSNFYRHPDESLFDLRELLNKLKINPYNYNGTISFEQKQLETDNEKEFAQFDLHSDMQLDNQYVDATNFQEEEENELGNNEELESRDNGVIKQPTNLSTKSHTYELVIEASQYINWSLEKLPNPNFSPINDIIDGLIKIIEVEGPMICSRAYRLYAKAAGIERIGHNLLRIFNEATRRAIRKGLIQSENEHYSTKLLHRILRKTGTSAIILRQLGNRIFDEVPPSEVALLMRQIYALKPKLFERDVFKMVLKFYGISRLTSDLNHSLSRIKKLYIDEPDKNSEIMTLFDIDKTTVGNVLKLAHKTDNNLKRS